MGKGICADCYVGNRQAQENFRLFYGGSEELPCEIQRRLDRQKRRKKNNARRQAGRKDQKT